MDDLNYQRMTQNLVKKKFGSHRVLLSKRKTNYPAQAEREYERITNAYMRLLSKRLKQYLPQIRDASKEEINPNSRLDGTTDLLAIILKIFVKMANDLTNDIADFGLYNRVRAMSVLTRNLSIAEWKRQIHAALGIDIVDDYYLGDLFQKCMREWVDTNVELIKTMPTDTLDVIKDLVYEGYRTGLTTSEVMKQVQKAYGISRRHVQLIARDQVAKLNGQIAQLQQKDAGIKEYIWSDCGDERVRERHQELNGKRFSWDEPPIVDFKNMRRCHPGEDYQCRCVALPVFEFDTLNLPVVEKKQEMVLQ